MKLKSKLVTKILETRITDTTFKTIFLGAAGLVVFSVIFLLLQTVTLRDSIYTITKQQAITILDESGNVFKKKLYETNFDIATIFGITYVKKSLGYGYLNYNRVANFLKIYSMEDVYDKQNVLISGALKQLKIINGSNIVKINNYNLKNIDSSNNKFIFKAIVNQELVSESKSNKALYFVSMNIEFKEPSTINASGIYTTSYNIELYDAEKHKNNFK